MMKLCVYGFLMIAMNLLVTTTGYKNNTGAKYDTEMEVTKLKLEPESNFSVAAGVEDSRTFGRIKKLQMSLLPIMFKLGVMSTIIMIILVLSLKSVFIGVLLLITNVALIFTKLIKLKHTDYHYESGWQPTSVPIPEQKIVHVHIYKPGPSTGPANGYPYYNDQYSKVYSNNNNNVDITSGGGSSSNWQRRRSNRPNEVIYEIDNDYKYPMTVAKQYV